MRCQCRRASIIMSLLLWSIVTIFISSVGLAQTPPAPDATPEAHPPTPPGSNSDHIASDYWSGTISLPGAMKIQFFVTFKPDAKSEGGYIGTIDIPVQGIKDGRLTDIRYGAALNQIAFNYPIPGSPFRADFTCTLAGSVADAKEGTGLLKQAGQEFPISLKRITMEELAAGTEFKRPQKPRPPFPYEVKDVSYINSIDGTKLAGSISLPPIDPAHPDAKFPAVLLITGSGPQDRNETIMGHEPFLVIADYLTRQGIIVLRVDDRGVGGSTGDMSKATTADFAGDVQAGVTFLKSFPRVAPHHIGLIGHSEGGLIAPMVAAKDPEDVAFIILLAGPGTTGKEILEKQMDLIGRAGGMAADEAAFRKMLDCQKALLDAVTAGKPEEEISRCARALVIAQGLPADSAALDSTVTQVVSQMTSPWFRFFLSYDPGPTLRKVKCPVLALDGTKDLQVPPEENIAAIRKYLAEGGNTKVTTKIFPNLNHLFQHCTTGSPGEYAVIEETFAPEVLKYMSAWIGQQVSPSDDGAGNEPTIYTR